MAERAVDVFCGLGGELVRAGRVYFHGQGTALRSSFSYAQEWLNDTRAYPLDPTAPLQSQTIQTLGLPPFLSDAAPERWGRHLVFRGAQDVAQMEGRALRSLDDVDYLLGVDDWSRMGALRLSVDGGETFLGAGTDVPRLVRLPELVDASRSVTAGMDGWRQVKSLLDAGSSSLGGARPKATVADGDVFLLAKFPSARDRWDVIAWEAWTLEMARRAGLATPVCRTERIGDNTVLLEERFDRDDGLRVPFLSGLSALGLMDGADSDYVELADAVRSLSTDPEQDIEELFGRMVLSVAIHNTDDHLRNHGFLRGSRGWRLSPVYDVNPNPYENEGRALPILGEAADGEIGGLREFADLFAVDRARQHLIVFKVVEALKYWKAVARRMGCSAKEVAMFAPIFEVRCAALREAFA